MWLSRSNKDYHQGLEPNNYDEKEQHNRQNTAWSSSKSKRLWPACHSQNK